MILLKSAKIFKNYIVRFIRYIEKYFPFLMLKIGISFISQSHSLSGSMLNLIQVSLNMVRSRLSHWWITHLMMFCYTTGYISLIFCCSKYRDRNVSLMFQYSNCLHQLETWHCNGFQSGEICWPFWGSEASSDKFRVGDMKVKCPLLTSKYNQNE
jgi:hypothetical protein